MDIFVLCPPYCVYTMCFISAHLSAFLFFPRHCHSTSKITISKWPMHRLQTIGDQSDTSTTGVSLKCSVWRLRIDQGAQGERIISPQTTSTRRKKKKQSGMNHLWSPWKPASTPSSHLLMKPQSPFY